MGWDGMDNVDVWFSGSVVRGGLLLCIYIYIIYTPNLRLGIAVSVREREQGRFKGSSEGAKGSNGGAPREERGADRERYGAVQGRSRWEPKLAALSRLQLPILILSK